MQETFSLQEIFQTLKKRSFFIIATVLIALSISALITFFILEPKYEASTQVLVNQAQSGNEEVTSSNIQSSRELISTYNVILTSPAILEPVVQETNFDGSAADLRSNVTVSAEEESQVVNLTIENNDPQVAVSLANTIAETFEQEISNIMDIDNVSILSEAQISESSSPVSPQPGLNLMVALVVGLILGTGIAIALEFLDKSIRNEQDIEKELDLPILGVIPTMEDGEFKNSSNRNNGLNLRTKNRESERKTS